MCGGRVGDRLASGEGCAEHDKGRQRNETPARPTATDPRRTGREHALDDRRGLRRNGRGHACANVSIPIFTSMRRTVARRFRNVMRWTDLRRATRHGRSMPGGPRDGTSVYWRAPGPLSRPPSLAAPSSSPGHGGAGRQPPGSRSGLGSACESLRRSSVPERTLRAWSWPARCWPGSSRRRSGDGRPPGTRRHPPVCRSVRA